MSTASSEDEFEIGQPGDEDEIALADEFLESLVAAGISVSGKKTLCMSECDSSSVISPSAHSSQEHTPRSLQGEDEPTSKPCLVGFSTDDIIPTEVQSADKSIEGFPSVDGHPDPPPDDHSTEILSPDDENPTEPAWVISEQCMDNFPHNDEDPNDPEWVCSENEQPSEDLPLVEENAEDCASKDSNGESDKPPPKGRKRKADRSLWSDISNKALRESGKAYVGWKKPNKDAKSRRGFQRGERSMGPACFSRACRVSRKRFCNGFSETERERLFQRFWSDMKWDQRKVYIASLVKEKPVQRHRGSTGPESSRRQCSKEYTLLYENGLSFVVCKKLFLSTFGLKESQVSAWAHEGSTNSGMARPSYRDAQGRNRPERPDFVYLKEFLDSLSKLPSHYCRKSTNKVYLEPAFDTDTLSAVYRAYEAECSKNDRKALSRFTFTKIAKNLNIGFQLPKKDKCDVCCSHEAGNVSLEEYEAHQASKDEARRHKEADKERSEKNEVTMLTMDLMAVKVCPLLNASSLYFKTKLCVHNFSILNVGNKNCHCYWWDESQCDLSADTFATLIVDYVLKNVTDFSKDLIIWSDNCGYQNKCAAVSNALLILSCEKNVVIYQKYLQRGHTQMEVDSVHAGIERTLKNKRIFLPSDYLKISLDARLTTPYGASMVGYEVPKKFSDRSLMRYPSIRPGKRVGDLTVSDVKTIKYLPEGKILVQTNFDGPFIEPSQRPSKKPIPKLEKVPAVRDGPIKINRRKWDDLQALLPVLPRDCHGYYKSLPHL